MVPKTQVVLVIFSGTQHKTLGTRYIKRAGRKTTTIRSKAVKFSTFAEAQEFAQQNRITLDAHTYIGQEDFREFDLHR